MKKLRLKALSLGAKEILSREELKKINGGSTPSQGCCYTIPQVGLCPYESPCFCDGVLKYCTNPQSCYANSATGCY